MPTVSFVRSKPGSAGDVPATGFFRFVPTRARTIPGDPDETILPVPFKQILVGGAVTVDLDPTGTGWAWQVFESVDGIRDETYYLTVPDVPGPLDDTDLARVDPASLSPRATPEPAWWAAANATISAAEIVGDDLILTRHDGTTVNAGAVRATAGELAALAADAAATAAPAAALAAAPAAAAAAAPAAAAAAAIQLPAGAMYVRADTDGRPYYG